MPCKQAACPVEEYNEARKCGIRDYSTSKEGFVIKGYGGIEIEILVSERLQGFRMSTTGSVPRKVGDFEVDYANPAMREDPLTFIKKMVETIHRILNEPEPAFQRLNSHLCGNCPRLEECQAERASLYWDVHLGPFQGE